jgi:hypothetical protein
VKEQRTMSLAIENILKDAKHSFRNFRREWNRLERYEAREFEGKKIAKAKRSKTGQNMRLSGTYGFKK